MPRRKLARKPEDAAERILQLVPPPKPAKRRPRWKVGRILKPKYHMVEPLLRYEEALVLACFDEPPYTFSVRGLVRRYPERFNRKFLWLTLVRLYKDGKLESGRGLGARRPDWRIITPDSLGLWWKYKYRPYRPFWKKEVPHGTPRERTDRTLG